MPDEIDIDARGLLCPLPVLRLARALRGAPDGSVAVLRATDLAAQRDVEAYCRESGQALLSCEREGALLTMRVRKA